MPEFNDLTLTSYTLHPAAPGGGAEPPIKMVLRGSGFRLRAAQLTVRIGDSFIHDVEIEDESTAVVLLDHVPEEGATITAEYDLQTRGRMPDVFSITRLGQAPPDPVA